MTTTNTTTTTTTAEQITPAEMFNNLKAKHPDAVLLFRCGDFYEAYEDDARTCEDVLCLKVLPASIDGLTLRAGFEKLALDICLPILIRAGHKVAICDAL
jgi:DNA mismatch repair protein MutS